MEDTKEPKLVGMMLYYVNVGTLSVEQAETLVDAMATKHGELHAELEEIGYRMLYIPIRTGDGRIETIRF
jgi:hypothetical protein